MQPTEWRFFSSSAFPETRVFFAFWPNINDHYLLCKVWKQTTNKFPCAAKRKVVDVKAFLLKEQFYIWSLKVACTLLNVHPLMHVMHLSRYPYDNSLKNANTLKISGYIEMFNRCNTKQSFQHFLSMHLITHSKRLFSLHTKRFKAHRLNIKSQNESNVDLSNYVSFIFRLFKFIGSWHNLKSTWMSTLKSATFKGASTF